MESLDPANLASVNKSFNKPEEYAAVLQPLARRNVYAITSFIFGLDRETPGVAERTLSQFANGRPCCRLRTNYSLSSHSYVCSPRAKDG